MFNRIKQNNNIIQLQKQVFELQEKIKDQQTRIEGLIRENDSALECYKRTN